MSKARDIVETLRTVLVDGDVTNANFTGADLDIAKGGTGASSAGAARTALGLAIGTDVLAPNGSAANLTNLPASGSADFVASGTLPNGKPVVLNSNGTVTVVAETSTSISESIPSGSSAVFNAGSTNSVSVAFDPYNANNFLVVYKDGGNSNYGTIILGTVSNNSISFGSAVVFYSYMSNIFSVVFDPHTSGKFLVTYQTGEAESYHGAAKVGTLSGSSISFGSAVTFNAGTTDQITATYDPNTANKCVITFRDYSNSAQGTAVVGTLSGSSISFGSEVIFYSSNGSDIHTSFDVNNSGKFVVAYKVNSTNYGAAIVGTLSGSSVSFGTAVVFNSAGTTYQQDVAFSLNTANKFVVVYQNGGNSLYGTSILGTVSGTSLSFATAVVFNAGNSQNMSIAFDPNTSGRFIISYRESANTGYGNVVVGTLSGSSLSYSSAHVLETSGLASSQVSFDPSTNGKFVVGFQDTGASSHGKAILGQLSATTITTNLTTTNFLGTSTAAYTNGQTAKIMLQGGISTNQSSLAIGSTYYVQPTGTLTTSAGTPSVEAGKAVSATTLLLKGI